MKDNNLMLAWLASLAAAAGVWVLRVAIAYFIGREFSLIAVGVGVVSGRVIAHFMHQPEQTQSDRIPYGIAATLSTAIVLVAVRYGIWYFIVNEPAYPFMQFLIDEVASFDRESLLLILFYGIAIYSAFVAAGSEDESEETQVVGESEQEEKQD